MKRLISLVGEPFYRKRREASHHRTTRRLPSLNDT